MSTIVFLIVLGVLILIHEFGHFIFAKKSGVKVERFSIGFGPRLFGFKKGDTEYLISLFLLGGYVKLACDSFEDKPKGDPGEFLSKPVGVRARIILAGPFLNYLLGFLLFSTVFMMGNPTLTPVVGELLEGYPAVERGLRKGDNITAIDGVEVVSWDDVVSKVSVKTEGEINLSVERDGEKLSIVILPKIIERKDVFGSQIKVAMIGIAPSGESVRITYRPIKALQMGASKVFSLTAMTLKALYFIITGQMSMKQAVTGPVGIFIITGKAAQMGFVYLLQIMAILSTSLAIFNVLPIPVLDGGHLLFLAIEKVRRKPLSMRTQYIVTQVGLYMLIGMMVFVFYTDFVKWGIWGKILGVFKY